MSQTATHKGEWLEHWDPEDEKSWDSSLAWRTLWITTFCLTLAFIAWFLPSAIIPKLNALGYEFTKEQLYWMAAMPGLSAGLFRLVWMVLPPILGTRKMVSITTLLLIASTLGWGVRVQSPTAPYWELMVLAFLAGIGGGAFSGFMPSTSYFFPKRKQGTALGLQAGIGNLGVSIVQLLTPYLIAISALAVFGGSQQMTFPAQPDETVWYQNAAFVWIPLMVIGAILAWTMLKSVPVKANIKQQFDIFKNQDTWWMTILYIMTFGTFSGLAAQFGLLMINLYGSGNPEIVEGTGATATLLIDGYAVPEAVKYVFLGPLIGAVARFAFSPLTDKMGGAIWTLISGIGIAISVVLTIPALTPDTSSAAALEAGFNRFLWGMLAIFLFAGIGNASTFKQMPMIFERRQAGGVIGWTAAIAAFGPFFFGVGLNAFGPVTFYWIGAAWAVMCIALTWWRYARPGAPKPG
jgi:NNP family nitrate/nitrite transporter-like MFS transporter